MIIRKMLITLTMVIVPILSLNVSGQIKDTLDRGEKIIKTAVSFIGVPYRYGSSGPKSFDCSGFTKFIYGNYGVNLTRSAHTQYKEGKQVHIYDVKPGDLVFFKGRKAKSKKVGHVGIVMTVKDNGSFDFIHSRYGGVGVDNSEMKYYKVRMVGARRIM